jgi:cell division protein FtsB
MTKAEARKLARLEAENAELRAKLARIQSGDFDLIRETCAYRAAMAEIAETITTMKEFAE